MIDDDEEDYEEDEEDGVDPEGPPSPSASPPPSPNLGTTQKSRPTTLNLSNAVSQVTAADRCRQPREIRVTSCRRRG